VEDKWTINFSVNRQDLRKTGGIDRYASNIVGCVDAVFSLSDEWQDLDIVSAVWRTKGYRRGIATILDDEGRCEIPQEVLRKKDIVYVNLVGFVSDGEALVTRLTSYDLAALVVDCDTMITGAETAPITPSQYEQFVNAVSNDADRAEAAKESARAYAEDSAASADESEEWAHTAEQAAGQSGYMFFHIDERGHLIYERTTNVEVDFYLQGGHLYVEGIA